MTKTVARFFNFQLDPDGKDVIYRGVVDGQGVVEIRQAAADLDIMLVLIAATLERSLSVTGGEESAHVVDDVTLQISPDGGIIVTFGSPPGVTRRFRLTKRQAATLSTGLKRAGLQIVA